MTEPPERRFEHWRRTGDTRALADVFDELAPRLLRLAIHLVGDVSTAEDLVQTTFVSAIESAANWDANRQLEPWLTGILDHRARNVLKVRRDRPATDPVVLVDDDTPLARAISDEHSRELVKALDQLDEPFRSPMILSALHGLKPAAIAHALDRSPGAVRVQLHRAREMLRKSLSVGIASALALLAEPARGLDAIRVEVLATATKVAPGVGVAGAVLGGGLLMKKVVIAAAILLASLALFLVASREPSEPEQSVIATEVVELAEPTDLPADPAVTVPEVSVEEARRAVPTQDMPHRLLGRVREFPGEAPVAGATVELHPVVQRTRAEFDALWASRSQPLTHGSVTPFMMSGAQKSLLQRAGLEPILDYARPIPGATALASVTTDSEGRFELPSPSLAGVVVVRAAGYGERIHPWLERSSETESERDVYVTRSGRLSARLIDESGAPYEQRVRLTLNGHVRFVLSQPVPGQRSDIHGDVWEVETDETGRFTTDVAAQVVFVRSQDPRVGVRQYGWATPDGRGCEPRPWLSPGAETRDCVIVVRPTCVLSVTDAAGAPIERFHLATKRRPGSSLSWSTWNGWFAAPGGRKCITPEMEYIDDLPARIAQDGPWSCKVWAPGFAPAELTVEDPWKAQVIEVRLTAESGAHLSGRVLRSARSAPEVPIVILESFGKSWSVPDDDPGRIWTPIAGARTDAEGRFAIELLPGRHLALIGEGPERIALPVEVPTADFNVDLEQHARLRIRLALLDGAPAVDRPVLVRRPDGGRIEGRSDARGEFVIQATCVGEHVVSSSAATSLDQRKWDVEDKVEARAGVETVLDLVLKADVPIFGRLVVPGTEVLAGWKAHVRGWPDTLVAIEPTGRIPIDLREAGSLVLSGPDGFEIMLNVPKDVLDGHEFTVDVGTIGYEGVLTSIADGKPIPRVRVLAYLREPQGKGMHVATTGADGRYRLLGLESAPYRIVFEGGPGRTIPIENMIVLPDALPSDPAQALDLALPTRHGAAFLGTESIQLVGRLAWSSQKVEGVQVQFSSELTLPGARVYVTQTSVLTADGRYDVRLPRGSKYSAWFWQPGTGAKESVSWPGSGAAIEQHDVDLP